LTHVGRSVVSAGLVVGSGGNLSARDPGADEFWVTARGTWLDRLTPADFVRVNLTTGHPVVADVSGAATPTSELALHLASYRARPDATAIVHLHPQSVLLLDALGIQIRLVTTDHVFYLGRIAGTRYAPPGTPQLATAAAQAAADGTNCVLLAQHGCSVLADSVELAHKRALYLEEAAQFTYRAAALGRLADLPPAPVLANTV